MAQPLPMTNSAANSAASQAVTFNSATDLCDGCHYPHDECCCDEIEADREAEYGKFCHTCGCDGEDGYANCPFRARSRGGYAPGSCPELTGIY